jgi:hypothetical protein
LSTPTAKQIAHTIKVTVFSDDQNPQPAPVLVLNHGRATDAQGRLARLSPTRRRTRRSPFADRIHT